MLKSFVYNILHQRVFAITLVALMSLFPFLQGVSVVLVALITLQKGAQEGALIVLWSALPAVVLLSQGMVFPFLNNVLCGGVLVWGLALLLRRSVQWHWILYLTMSIGMLVLFLLHLYVPQLQAFWTTQLTQHIKAFLILIHQDYYYDIQGVQTLVSYATGTALALSLYSTIFELMLARFLQSRYCRGIYWTKEWKTLRLSFLMVLVLFMSMMFSVMSSKPFFKDALPLVMGPFVIVGMSVMHLFFKNVLQLSLSGFVLLYLVLGFFVLIVPVSLFLFVFVAVFDSVIHFRARRIIFN